MEDNKPNVQAEHGEGQQIAHPGVQVLVWTLLHLSNQSTAWAGV